MKRLSSLVILAVVGLAYTSCEDETLEMPPKDRYTLETAFASKEGCALSMTGMYARAQSGYYPSNGSTRGYPFGAASILQSDMMGEDMMNVASFFQVTYESAYTTAASSANNDAMWQNSFSVITQANLCIDGVTKAAANGVISEEQRDYYIGEARFIRALTYHNLLILFARPYAESGNNRYGLPYYDYPLYTDADFQKAADHGRDDLDLCYRKILEDLDFAENNLNEKGVDGEGKVTFARTNKAAAIALKVRVNLHKADYNAAKTEAAKLVSAAAPYSSPIGGYTLTADPAEPFTNYTANVESIFSIENSTIRNATTNGSLGSMMSASSRKGRALVAVSPIAYNNVYWLGPDKDKRRALLDNNATAEKPVYFTNKYADDVPSMSNWAPIIRYAEVLLSYAEAIVRSGGTIAEALPYLNEVRNRSLVDPATDAYIASDFASTTDFLNAVYGERRIEFLAEGRRWEDIHRLLLDPVFSAKGIPAKVQYGKLSGLSTPAYQVGAPVPNDAYYDPSQGANGYIPYADRRCVWPIPESTTILNPKMKSQQNADW